ncbi:LOW QUALITY PROTEIN: DNA polymerase iota-like [Portunus trituberculatus]|uniref:LOW QUALITY PROTEIN: DNA polymerase iota-like n=1 Tax=Portunus trituberculatus TaxID=210409 RepID=UPI001E1CF3F5|nr:LOW QUALITY PROTEIN: DNA polymerase iota-like [Portunus trituberculatus]
MLADDEEEVDEPHFTVAGDAWVLLPADHRRVIIHLDADCFYAQVEMVRNPTLRDKPLGVKQKNLMVTSNYVARSMGVKKSMWIKEALEALPDLILVDGSDLTHYRQCSSEISAVVRTFSVDVERLGLDENFVDVTEILEDYIGESDPSKIEAHVYGDKESDEALPGDPCGCGCRERLIAGAVVAKKIRQQIVKTTGITCCAGVAHNKLLAKLVSGYYKPDQQTVLFPWLVHQLMNSLNLTRSIPGIGSTMCKTLEELGIYTVKDLQKSSLALLHSKFDDETSKRLKDLSYGIDDTPVRRSGRPQTIGLEDAFRKVNSIDVVQSKYLTLLERLLKLLKEDGRIPSTLRVCVRKFDTKKKFGNRESRQTPILPSLFASGVQNVGENARTTLMNQVMELFHKMVDTSKEFHLTLLSIGFTKFIERASHENSISRFFVKRKRSETEEQDINERKSEDSGHLKSFSSYSVDDSNIYSSDLSLESCSESDSFSSEAFRNIQGSMNIKDMLSKSHHHSSERKILKTSKKISMMICINKHLQQIMKLLGQIVIRIMRIVILMMCHHIKGCKVQEPALEDSLPAGKGGIARLPHGIDKEVFQALPLEIQDEIILNYKSKPPDPKPVPKIQAPQKPLPNHETVPKKISSTETNAEPVISHHSNNNAPPPEGKDDGGEEMSAACGSSSSGLSLSNLQPPEGVDPSVFSALPWEIQKEIVEEQRRSLSSSSVPRVSNSSSHSGRRRETSSSIMKYIKKV